MIIGTVVGLSRDVGEKFGMLKNHGIRGCQLCGWSDELFDDDAYAAEVVRLAKENDITISTFWCGWPGPAVWDFIEGPLTLGLVPAEYRWVRIRALQRGAEFAKKIGVTQMATHAGFIPENPCDGKYAEVIAALRVVVGHCRHLGVRFLFETGQETPVTLRRAIEDLGGEGLGINLDTGNLLLYGKGNPADAIDVFGEYVCDLHAKDGEYPTNGRELGKEKALGEGRANFPGIIAALKKKGYDGPITIEREIHGPQQTVDILKAKSLLEYYWETIE